MMLTANDIMLVRASFARVAPIKDAAADLFTAAVRGCAAAAPAVSRRAQKQKLMAMIAMAAGGLDDFDALMPKVKALGMRHVTYGATAGHYEVVGEVLLWTLERSLGDAFTPDVRAAWTKVCGVLAATMQAGAADLADMQAAE
jgi:hemoglobin-like flavoprotein